jgi:hypothetical protein
MVEVKVQYYPWGDGKMSSFIIEIRPFAEIPTPLPAFFEG